MPHHHDKIHKKHSAARAGKPLGDGSRDEGTGNWLSTTSPEGLFKYNIDVDFETLVGYQPLLFNHSNLNDSSDTDDSRA